MALIRVLLAVCWCNHALAALLTNATATHFAKHEVTCVDDDDWQLDYPALATMNIFTLKLTNCTLSRTNFPKLWHIGIFTIMASDASVLSLSFPAFVSATTINANVEDTSTISSFKVGSSSGLASIQTLDFRCTVQCSIDFTTSAATAITSKTLDNVVFNSVVYPAVSPDYTEGSCPDCSGGSVGPCEYNTHCTRYMNTITKACWPGQTKCQQLVTVTPPASTESPTTQSTTGTTEATTSRTATTTKSSTTPEDLTTTTTESTTTSATESTTTSTTESTTTSTAESTTTTTRSTTADDTTTVTTTTSESTTSETETTTTTESVTSSASATTKEKSTTTLEQTTTTVTTSSESRSTTPTTEASTSTTTTVKTTTKSMTSSTPSTTIATTSTTTTVATTTTDPLTSVAKVRITGVTEEDIDDNKFATAAADAINAGSVIVLVKPSNIVILSKTRGSAIVTFAINIAKDNTKALYCVFDTSDVFAGLLARLQKQDKVKFGASSINGTMDFCSACPAVPKCPKTPQIIVPPSNEAASSGGDGSKASATIIPVVVVVAVLVVIAVAVMVRRKRSNQDVKPFSPALIANPAYVGGMETANADYAVTDPSLGDDYLQPKVAEVHYDIVGDEGQTPTEGFEAFYDSIGAKAMQGQHGSLQAGAQADKAVTYAFAAPEPDTYDNTNADEPAPLYAQAHVASGPDPSLYDTAQQQATSDPDYAFATTEPPTDPTYDTAQGQGPVDPLYDLGRGVNEPVYDVGQTSQQDPASEPTYDLGQASEPTYDVGEAAIEPFGQAQEGLDAIYDTATPSAEA